MLKDGVEMSVTRRSLAMAAIASMAGLGVAWASSSGSSLVGDVIRGAANDLERRLRPTMRFLVGENRERSMLYVADPRCPFCHRAWAVIRPYVARGEFALDVLLIGAMRGSEEIAVSVLTRPDPGAAWMAGQGSTATAMVPQPPPRDSLEYLRAVDGLRANLDFARGIGLPGTPWLAYVRGEDIHHMIGAGDVQGFIRQFLS